MLALGQIFLRLLSASAPCYSLGYELKRFLRTALIGYRCFESQQPPTQQILGTHATSVSVVQTTCVHDDHYLIKSLFPLDA